MSLRHRRLVTLFEAFESFPLRYAFMNKGVDFRRLQTRPTLLHFHSVAACVRCVVEFQDTLLESRVFAVNYHPWPRIGNNLSNRSFLSSFSNGLKRYPGASRSVRPSTLETHGTLR